MFTSSIAQDELTLVRCAQAGDRAAFDVLADRYRALILATTFLRTSSKDEAEDLTQEVFAKAWVHLPVLKEPAAFIAWLRTIAANACRDWYRKAPWPESLTDLSEHIEISTPGPDELVVVHDNQSQSAFITSATPRLPPHPDRDMRIFDTGMSRAPYQVINCIPKGRIFTAELIYFR